MTESASDPDTLWLVYDGDCPLCQASVLGVRIKKAAGKLMTLDARTADEHELMTAIAAQGLDLNQGMVMRYHGQLYHGADALHLLALLSSPSDGFNRFNAWMFKSKTRVSLLYPLMKLGRRLSLRIVGKDLI